MDTKTEPRLDAPGAGLPALELFFARRLFARKRRVGSRESFTRTFEQERDEIRRLVEDCLTSQRDARILIKRLRGLEDSSRFWSVWMTLDHLRITNQAFAGVITQLSKGSVPEREASTAAVKPSPEAGEEIEEAFEKSCDMVLSSAASVENLQTEATYAHPWFGPLDAAGWYALAAFHMGIHRGQIEKIRKGLGR